MKHETKKRSRSTIIPRLTNKTFNANLTTRYFAGLVKEVQDAWQMPKCGISPRATPLPVEITTIFPEPLPTPFTEDVLLKPSILQKVRRPCEYIKDHDNDDSGETVPGKIWLPYDQR